jgi:hypothetical protein
MWTGLFGRSHRIVGHTFFFEIVFRDRMCSWNGGRKMHFGRAGELVFATDVRDRLPMPTGALMKKDRSIRTWKRG